MSALVSLCFALSIPALPAIPVERRTPVVQVVEQAGPSVVSIGAEIVEENPFSRSTPFDRLWRDFYGQQRREPTSQSLGSGVIIDKTGLVLTNEHVIARANSITVTLRDRRTFAAEVVGADPAFDVAVLRLKDSRDLPLVELGASSDLMPGETVVAIGNPFGLSNTVTTGVVSALHRSVPMGDRAYEDFIQTDAAINPGNSGGALLNIQGKLIGINTAIYGAGTGIGFAIPIDKAMAVVDEVLRYGEVRPAFLGIIVDDAPAGGAVVTAVDPDSSAASAGLKPGDRIVDLSGQQVTNGRALRKLQRGLVPGQEVRLRLLRGAETSDVTIKVRELTLARAAQLGRARLGLEVKDTREGLVISAVNGKSDAARVGLRRGDLLFSLAGQRLRAAKDFDVVCAAIRDAEAVAAIIGRGGRRYYVTLSL
ncbi:MAG: trypsin-like peptidase domain-containing protein [Deltaproteobacteria bacterium]|nr:trypsin-like peptidase domain-containing protein [Deltaproteobacteria bacterium]